MPFAMHDGAVEFLVRDYCAPGLFDFGQRLRPRDPNLDEILDGKYVIPDWPWQEASSAPSG